MSPSLTIRWLVLAGIIFVAIWIVRPSGSSSPSVVYAQQKVVAERAREDLIASADQLSMAFRNVAKAVKPSVVSISVTIGNPNERVAGRRQRMPFPPEFEQFFGGRLFDEFDFQMPQRPQEDMGSGVIVSPDGYIITNNHVVRNASKISVQLSDNRSFDARLVGTDEKGDLAVLKVDASGLVAAPIGDSSDMEVGDWVIAIGSPFGLAQTVTAGIISAMNREENITQYDDLIQTDAAINPGNSGGPLLNLRGEIIGINMAIASRSGSFDGIGFAIPSNMVRAAFDSIIKHGRMVRGYLGTSLEDLTPAGVEHYGLPPGTSGVYIANIAEDGPASKGGLQVGDVVVSLDGKPIQNSSQLRREIALISPGQRTSLGIIRNGKSLTLNVIIEEQTDEKLAAIAGGRLIEQLGIEIAPVPSNLARQAGLSSRDGGVLVTGVNPGGALGELLVVRDIILSVNDQPVRNATDFTKAVGQNDRSIKLVIRRGRSTLTATLTLR